MKSLITMIGSLKMRAERKIKDYISCNMFQKEIIIIKFDFIFIFSFNIFLIFYDYHTRITIDTIFMEELRDDFFFLL